MNINVKSLIHLQLYSTTFTYSGVLHFCINERITGNSVSNKHILNTKFHLPGMNLQLHKSTCSYIFLATEE